MKKRSVSNAARRVSSAMPARNASTATSFAAFSTVGLHQRRPHQRRRRDEDRQVDEPVARRRQPVTPPSITTPDALRLKIEPMADCGRYDSIRKIA